MTVTDSTGEQSTATATLTTNRAPKVPTLSLSLIPPTILTISLALQEIADLDGDNVTESYAWTLNGVAGTNRHRAFSGKSAGDTVACTVSVTDGLLTTSAVASIILPTQHHQSLRCLHFYTNDTITASATASDPDGQTVLYTFD